MLFMLWIKCKFSECLAPCTNMKASNGRLSGDGSVQACRHGDISEDFVVLRKFFFKYMIKTKLIPPWKCVFPPKTLKPGYGPRSAKIVSAMGYFVLKAIQPQDVAYRRKRFLYITVRGPLWVFCGVAELGCYGTVPMTLDIATSPEELQMGLVELHFDTIRKPKYTEVGVPDFYKFLHREDTRSCMPWLFV